MEQYNLPYNIKDVGKDIKKGNGTENFKKKIRILKNGSGEEYQVVGNFIHPWIKELKIELLDVVFKCFDECEEENQRSDWLEGRGVLSSLFIKSFGEEYQVLKGEGNIMARGKNLT